MTLISEDFFGRVFCFFIFLLGSPGNYWLLVLVARIHFMCCSPSPSQLEFMKTSVPHCFVRVSVASPLVGLAYTYLDLSKAT